MGLLLVPAARENLRKSIEAPVNIQFAQLYLPKELINEIMTKAGQEGIRCWAVSSKRQSIYNKIEEGNIVLFTEKGTGKFTHQAEVVTKTDNVIFGDALWPIKGDNPWKYIYFLKNIRHISIDKKDFVQSLGFSSKYIVPGTIKVDNEKYNRFLNIKDKYDFTNISHQKPKYFKKNVSAVREPRVQYTPDEVQTFPSLLKPKPYAPKIIREAKQIEIDENQTGLSYENLFGEYLIGASEIKVKDPYVRLRYQIKNFMEFAKLISDIKLPGEEIKLHLTTNADYDNAQLNEQIFKKMAEVITSYGIKFIYKFDNNIHDRSVSLDTGWKILLGRGLDIFKKPENDFIDIADIDQKLRKCKACEVTIINVKE